MPMPDKLRHHRLSAHQQLGLPGQPRGVHRLRRPDGSAFATGRACCAWRPRARAAMQCYAVELLYCVALGTFGFARRRIVVDTSHALRGRPTSPAIELLPRHRGRGCVTEAGCGGFVTDRRTGVRRFRQCVCAGAARQGLGCRGTPKSSDALVRGQCQPDCPGIGWRRCGGVGLTLRARRTLARRRSLARSTVTG